MCTQRVALTLPMKSTRNNAVALSTICAKCHTKDHTCMTVDVVRFCS